MDVTSESKVRRNLSKRWYNLIARCNNPNHPRYKDYGAAGVRVDERWMSKENFLKDAPNLPGYDEKRLLSGDLHLDKDIRIVGNKTYSKDTCSFVSQEDNNRSKPSQMVPFQARDPEGNVFKVTNQSEFARQHGLQQSTISDCLKGRIVKHKGWTFKYEE